MAKRRKEKDEEEDKPFKLPKFDEEAFLKREKRNIKDHEIFDLMHIDPGDLETIKALNRQLDTLFEYNLVKKYKGGIQWLG